ncbi:hypothetical protein PENVUL_c005G03367 [Penicillium vulpinum]|uniref:Cyanovirin-N domain-containing protein n=1 Tax=Penicillium vulpinum TaxID=29845 RepID=A0A1V6S865_9EURO|nr:hypothetical protein PENVUL_c005G03367 [Penicillium vulpinum]
MQFIRLSFALFILLLAWADADNCWYDFSSDSRALTYSCQNFDDGGVFYTSSLKQSDCLRNEDGELLFQNGGGAACTDCFEQAGASEDIDGMIYTGSWRPLNYIKCSCPTESGETKAASIERGSVLTTVSSYSLACGATTAIVSTSVPAPATSSAAPTSAIRV